MVAQRDWLAIPHQKLYDDIHGGPGHTGHEAAHKYSAKLGEQLREAHNKLDRALRALGAIWEGGAADQAAGKIGALRTWTGDAGVFTLQLSDNIGTQMDQFVTARNAMPEPVDDTLPWGNATIDLNQLTQDREQVEARSRAAHVEAARVMENYALGVTAHVSPYIAPPEIGVGEVGGGGPAPTPVNPIAPRPRTPRGGTADGGSSFDPGPKGGRPQDLPIRKDNGFNENPIDFGRDHDRGPIEQVDHTPPSQIGGGGLGGVGAGVGGGTAGGGPTGGTGGGGLGLSGGFGGAMPSTGGAQTPGVPSPRGVTPLRPSAVPGATPGARPGGNQAFMQPALAQGKGEEDKEHQRRYDITEDIVGELPMVAPPVIGE